MRFYLKLLFFWYFAACSMALIAGGPFSEIRHTIHVKGAFRSVLSMSSVGWICLILAIVFGVASWNAFKDRYSAGTRHRAWMIAASLMSLMISIGVPVLYYFAQGWGA